MLASAVTSQEKEIWGLSSIAPRRALVKTQQQPNPALAARLEGTKTKIANIITLLLKSVPCSDDTGRSYPSTRGRSQLQHEETKKPRTFANYVTGGAGREKLIKSS